MEQRFETLNIRPKPGRKRLAVYDHIEHCVRHKQPGRVPGLPFTSLQDATEMADRVFKVDLVVDWRLQIGARVPISENASDAEWEARRDMVARMLTRHIYKDVEEEVERLCDWALQKGYDEEMLDRLVRLLRFVGGSEVDE